MSPSIPLGCTRRIFWRAEHDELADACFFVCCERRDDMPHIITAARKPLERLDALVLTKLAQRQQRLLTFCSGTTGHVEDLPEVAGALRIGERAGLIQRPVGPIAAGEMPGDAAQDQHLGYLWARFDRYRAGTRARRPA